MLPTITINYQTLPQTQTPKIHNVKGNEQVYPPQIYLPVPYNPSYPLQQLSPCQPSLTKKINNYVIDYNRKIGNGNFSHVYVGIDQKQPNIKLAVKVINVSSLR